MYSGNRDVNPPTAADTFKVTPNLHRCIMEDEDQQSIVVAPVSDADSCTELMEVNHDEQVVDTDRFDISREMEEVTLDSMQPAQQDVAKRLTTPIVNTFLDTRHIAFERYSSGSGNSAFLIFGKILKSGTSLL